MPFMCQRNSFLTEFDTEVVSCEPVNDLQICKTLSIEEPKEPNKLYEIVLKDTILFPEGGGQPDDRGVIGDAQIIRVIRKGTTAVHYAHLNDEHAKTLKSDETVPTKINWERRFDHMQQHSGQHLITAVTDQMYGFPTTSWWLGTDDCYIELDTKDVTQEQVKAIESEVNLKIRECRPVSVDVVELDDPKLKTARGRNLPEDVKGQIRIITMEGVEANVCCGTHVTNLSQLQTIVLLDVIKKKGKCHLYFLVGNRVIDRFSKQFRREQKLMGILKTSPEELPVAAEKLNIALKNTRKNCQMLSKDLSALEAQKIKQNSADSSSPLVIYHRDNVDLDFSSSLLRELGSMKGKLLLITLKTEGNSGHLIVRDEVKLDKEVMSELVDKLSEILDGKGTLRGDVYQAKVFKVNSVNKAVKFAQDFFKDKSGASKMNHQDIYKSASERLVPETNLRQGLQTFQTRAKMFRTLIEERKWPKEGWDDLSVELFLNELASMDSNNFPSKGGVGEREGRIYSSLVAKRHFRLSHGIGRSGNLTEVQPKATGSSLMNALNNALLLDLCRMQGSRKVADAFLVPMATGMTLALVLLTLKKEKPEGKYVIWPRIDQKSCFKCILTAGLEPIIIEPQLYGEELQTDVNSISEALTKYGPEILCVMTTTSCFAPRSCDNLEQVSKLCKENNVFHVVNNAYGLQSGKCAYAIQQAQKFGRLDVFVQSTDKNLLVPVGGAVIAGFDEELLNKIRRNYAGRASSSPVMDVFITMLSMGSASYTQLLKDRTENYKYLKASLQALGRKFGEHVVETPGNQISLAFTLKRLGAGLEVKQRNKVLTELGSMLFLRNVCGSRVITTREKKEIGGYEFEGWGASCKNYLFPYITAAATIGMTKADVDFFVEKLDECLFKLKKKYDLLEIYDIPPRELSETTGE